MPVLKVKNNGIWEDVAGASGHTHKTSDITDFPSSLPADGGNADTLDGFHASDFATIADVQQLHDQVGDNAVSVQISNAIDPINQSINNKVDKVDGHRLITSSEAAKLEALVVGDGGQLELSGKVNVDNVEGLNEKLDLKVDKVTGKGLSTNDFTTAEKEKLAGIATGANKITVDTALNSSSTNPVQNKVVNTAISNLNTLIGDTSVSAQISNAIANKSDVGHAHSSYVNQNAFSNVKVGSTTIAADTTTDTITLVAGDNVTITPDATNDKITIAATDTKYTHPNSGVAAGTYKSVTVDAQGHVTGGSNPTTLSGYGIIDAISKADGVQMVGDITDVDTLTKTYQNNSIIFRTLGSNLGILPSTYASYAKLRSSRDGNYTIWICTNGTKMWYAQTADGNNPTAASWKEIATVSDIPEIDDGLTVSGAAADAKAVGDALALKANVADIETALAGKAPAGFGYGETMTYLIEGNNLDAKLNEILSTMADKTAKQIQIYDQSFSDVAYLCTLWRFTWDYAVVDAVSYGGYSARKCKFGGAWFPWVWENPPMQPGVEYRTTELYGGQSVIKKLDATDGEVLWRVDGSDTWHRTNTTYSLSKSGSTIILTGSDGSVTSVEDETDSGSVTSSGMKREFNTGAIYTSSYTTSGNKSKIYIVSTEPQSHESLVFVFDYMACAAASNTYYLYQHYFGVDLLVTMSIDNGVVTFTSSDSNPITHICGYY